MDFKNELAKFGYNKGNSIDVDTLVNEILPKLFELNKNELAFSLRDFCEKEFKADFSYDYVNGRGSNTGMSDRTESFVKSLFTKKIKKNGR